MDFGYTIRVASFEASEFHKGFLDQFSIKTRNEHLYGEVAVYICKYARKRHFEKCPMQVRIVYSDHSNSRSLNVRKISVKKINLKQNWKRGIKNYISV